MSSMRNAVQRRNHKERAQPREREKWGLLEKHKDYALRARDYNDKKKRLKILRSKAADRNPDEFHFAMMSHRFRDGAKFSNRSEFGGMPHAASSRLKSVDAAYLRTVLNSTRKAKDRTREELEVQREQNGVDDEERAGLHGERRHVVFVDDEKEQAGWKPSRQRRAAGRRTHARGQAGDEMRDEGDVDEKEGSQRDEQVSAAELDRKQRKQTALAAQERKLAALRAREAGLARMEQELETQRGRMNKDVGGTTKAGLKFKIKSRKK